MNAIFGVFSRTGAPIAPDVLPQMAAAIPWPGRDSPRYWSQGPVAFGHMAYPHTPESQTEQQPAQLHQERLVITAEARLDNRTELLQRLGSPQLAGAPNDGQIITDPHLLLAAYDRWGQDCGVHLIGDYSFALWDAARQTVVCVRDAMGPVPFFYYLDSKWFIFANTIRAIVAHPAVNFRLDQKAMALHLASGIYTLKDSTHICGVHKLESGHSLSVTASGQTSDESPRRFWSPLNIRVQTLSSPEDYYANFRHLLDQAISDRLRSVRPIAAHASGGLDSTTIALLARRQLQARGEDLAAAYTWIPTPAPDDDPNLSELLALTNAAQALGMPIQPTDLTETGFLHSVMQNVALHGHNDIINEMEVQRKARASGVGVLLSGWGGDDVVTSGMSGYLAELLRKGAWGKLSRLVQARHDPGPNSWRRTLGIFYHHAIVPNLPHALFSFLQSRRPRSSWQTPVPLAPNLAALLDQMPHSPHRMEPELHLMQASRLLRGHLAGRMEVWACYGAMSGIRYTYPLLDRRLIEFCLGVPSDLCVDERYNRGFFRNAMQGTLPDTIRLDNQKFDSLRLKHYTQIARTALTRWWSTQAPELLSDPHVRDFVSAYIDISAFTQWSTARFSHADVLTAPSLNDTLFASRVLSLFTIATESASTSK